MSRRNRMKRTRRDLLGPVASPLLIFVSFALDVYDAARQLLDRLALNIRMAWGWWYEI
jgi:hypothetical protein